MCKVRNFLIDFKNLKVENIRDRYRTDVLKPGDIGGFCELKKDALKKHGKFKIIFSVYFHHLNRTN